MKKRNIMIEKSFDFAVSFSLTRHAIKSNMLVSFRHCEPALSADRFYFF